MKYISDDELIEFVTDVPTRARDLLVLINSAGFKLRMSYHRNKSEKERAGYGTVGGIAYRLSNIREVKYVVKKSKNHGPVRYYYR